MSERLKNWKTTLAGTAVGVGLLVIFKSFNCELPSDWLAWGVATIPAVLGAVSKD